MTLSTFDLAAFPTYGPWLEEQIRLLSVKALSSYTLTCNACGEITGTYIIEYQNKTFRLDGEKAYAFLSFIVSQ